MACGKGRAKGRQTMKRLAIAGAALLVLAGCAGIQQARQKQAQNEAVRIIAECKAQRLAGELDGFVAEYGCAKDRVHAVQAEAAYPYMDLVDLLWAHRGVLAKRVDAAELSEEEFELQHAEYRAWITTEIMRRNAARTQAYAARQAAIQAIGSDLQIKDKLRRMENRQRQIEQQQRNLQGCLQNMQYGVAC